MGWKQTVSVRLARHTPLQLGRGRDGRPRLVRRPGRLLHAPVFLFSSVRSGSTLLRMILNSHPAVYAPHELHLTQLTAKLDNQYVTDAMHELGFSAEELTHLLWDRVLERALTRSGKKILVEKTPHHTFMWSRIARCWPDARYLFLLRDPAAIAASWARARPQLSPDEVHAQVDRYATAVDEARRALPGHTVRYEDLARDAHPVIRGVCEFLGIEFDPTMLEYGRQPHGTIKAGLGDWTDRIRSGRIQTPRQITSRESLPEDLRALAVRWGYER
ncbi:sulfotransferase [Pilimelia columellifera]